MDRGKVSNITVKLGCIVGTGWVLVGFLFYFIAYPNVFLLRLWQPGGLEYDELDKGVQHEKGQSDQPPDGHMARDRLSNCFPAVKPGKTSEGAPQSDNIVEKSALPELEANKTLGGDDGGQDPALPTHPVTVRVVQELNGKRSRSYNASPKTFLTSIGMEKSDIRYVTKKNGFYYSDMKI